MDLPPKPQDVSDLEFPRFTRSPEAASYWENRLSVGVDLATVGSLTLGNAYNYWLYQARFRAMRRALQNLRLSLEGKSLVEAGVGGGAWLPFWLRHGVGDIQGVDITKASVQRLQSKYPQFTFTQADISSENVPWPRQQSGVVTALDVLFHITDDAGFSTAIRNLGTALLPQGILIIGDSFCNIPWGPTPHEYHRTYNHYVEELSGNGLEVIHIEPVFFTMATSLCGRGRKGLYRLFDLSPRFWYTVVGHLAARRPTEWINHFIGVSLYVIDGILARVCKEGPSLKLLFAVKC